MGDLRDPAAAERLAEEAPDEYLRRREFLQRAALTAGLGTGLATVLHPDTLVAEAARQQRRRPLPSPRNLPVDTFVVLMMENRSFDHYLGWMPEADGRQAGLTYVDEAGHRLSTRPLAPDWQGCAYVDPDHSWDGGREQLNNGKMDGFLRGRNDQFALSYYRDGDLGFIQAAAKASTTYDRFHCSVLGPTYPNRFYMHAAQSFGHKDNYLPVEEMGFPDQTIWAACERAGVSHRYFYSDIPVSVVFGQSAERRSGRVEEYYSHCAAGTLPHVSFVDPPFGPQIGAGDVRADEHPHGDVRAGQAFMSDIVHAFMESPQWKRGALFIVYDEWGGFFDHVRPPRVPDDRNHRDRAEDFGQLGMRIPALAVSPYARRGHVHHSIYGFESILKMIEWRFGLPPLTKRDRYAQNIARSFDWTSPPRSAPSLPTPPDVVSQPCSASSRPHGAAVEPHDLMRLHTSGYLDRLGFDYRPAKASEIFRTDPRPSPRP
ncbi:MAG TPA: alkaline phosphatase family protein [Solirubrobacteraceae bacterium]|nr:alkaline phosphatase family protein [Solirubrobacteraceae bacterium]